MPTTFPRLVAVALVSVATSLLATPAEAQDGTPAGSVQVETHLDEDGDVVVERRRPVPDYDGRGREPTSAGDVLLWVPRVLLAPAYLVSEYLLRRPLGLLVTTAELEDWPTLLIDFFTFGPNREAGIVPTALIDFGLRPSVGVYMWGDNTIWDGNDLRIRAAYGGSDWRTASVRDRVTLREDTSWLSFEASYEGRPDWVFYGLGFDSRDDAESRFEKVEVGGRAIFESHVWRASTVVWEAGVSDVHFGEDACCSDPSIVTRVEQGDYPALPPGWGGYRKMFERLEVALDTRRERPAPGSGVRIAIEGEHGFDLREPVSRRWVRYGGSVGGLLDLTGTNRVVSLTLTALFADELGSEPVPFTEQVSLGGLEHMRGFLAGRLVGRSAAVGRLAYRWPIWVWLDGTMHVAVGNVFGPHLRGLEPERLRLSFGIGFETVGSRDNSFGLILAAGSEPFERFRVSSVRFLFGTVAP